MAWQARQANRHLQSAVAHAPQLRAQVIAGDEAAVRSTVTAIGTDTEQARDALAGPHWWLAAHLPWIGTNAEALQTVTEVADDLSHQALPELTRAAEVLKPNDLNPKGGRVALEPIRKVQPYVQKSASSTRAADERLAGISPDDLVSPLRSRYVDATAKVSALNSTMDTVARATRILPSVLGAGRPPSLSRPGPEPLRTSVPRWAGRLRHRAAGEPWAGRAGGPGDRRLVRRLRQACAPPLQGRAGPVRPAAGPVHAERDGNPRLPPLGGARNRDVGAQERASAWTAWLRSTRRR